MATAHAAKFVDAVLSALPSVTGDAIIDSAGPAIAAVVRELPSLPMVATMWEKPEGEEWRAVWTQRLRDRIEGISARREGKA